MDAIRRLGLGLLIVLAMTTAIGIIEKDEFDVFMGRIIFTVFFWFSIFWKP